MGNALFLFQLQQEWLAAKARYRDARRRHKGQRKALKRLQEATLTLLKAELAESTRKRAA